MPAPSAKTLGKQKRSSKAAPQPMTGAVSAATSVDVAGNEGAKNGESRKGKRDKVVRDSFTMPAPEYERIGKLKKRCLALGVAIKKSELLRAGVAMLDQLSDPHLAQVVTAVVSVRTGRPPGKKEKKAG